jgi:peptidyl-tRNA hydrolase
MSDEIDFSKSKMYILVKTSIDAGHAALAVGHGALGGYLDFVEAERKKDFQSSELCPECGKPWDSSITQTEQWVKESFRKVVCTVTDEEFEKAKLYGIAGKDYKVITESGLGGIEVAIVFRPRVQWESFFKGLSLWGKMLHY